MTNAEQDIEMYMRVYAAAVTAVMRRDHVIASVVKEAADLVANDAVAALRKRLGGEEVWCGNNTDGGRYVCEFPVGHKGPHGYERGDGGKRWD